MVELLLWRKLSLKVLVGTMTVIGQGTVTEVGTVITTVTMEVVVDLVVVNASSVASQDILPENVLAKGAVGVGMVVGMIGMEAEAEAEAEAAVVMVLIEMQIDLEVVVGIPVVMVEEIDIVVTVLARMTVGVPEVSVGKMIAYNCVI